MTETTKQIKKILLRDNVLKSVIHAELYKTFREMLNKKYNERIVYIQESTKRKPASSSSKMRKNQAINIDLTYKNEKTGKTRRTQKRNTDSQKEKNKKSARFICKKCN